MKRLLPDYYAILGVARTADPKEIQRAYRQLARQHHPDHQPDVSKVRGAAERMKEINEAYAVLSDSKKRTDYDALLDALLRQRELPSQINLGDLFRQGVREAVSDPKTWISLLRLVFEQKPAARSKRSQPRRRRRPRRRPR